MLQDPVTLQYFRVGRVEREILEQLNGETSLGTIHDRLKATYGSRAPSFRDLVGFVFMLRHANLTVSSGDEEARWTVERAGKKRRQRVKQKLSSFMYLTIPLIDPERFLRATLPYVRWVFSRKVFVVWLLTLGAALFAFFYNVEAFASRANGILAPGNLVYLYLAFVLVKGCHEFGHAFAARHYGAEVHRMGVMFLIFMPVLYVDTTPVWAFPRKWPKVLVGAAGMMVELFIASLAVFGWLLLEPGTIRTILYNIIFIASVSALLFNGNPLLRYDAYYILADLIEIPNLRQRSTDYVKYLFKRYLVGERVALNTDLSREKVWFLCYGVLATLYRCFIVTGILLMIASKFFALGVALAVLVAILWILNPFSKLLKYIFIDKVTRPVRARAIGVFTGLVAAVVLLLGAVPIDSAVRAPCALEPAEQAMLRAEWPGFLTDVRVSNGQQVEAGQLLATLSNELLDHGVRRMELAVQESRARLRRLEATGNPTQATVERERLSRLQQDLQTTQRRQDAMAIHAPFDGRVIAPDLDRVHGRFLRMGEPVLAVASLEATRVTAAVETADIAALQSEDVRGTRIRFRALPARIFTGTIERIHPSATHQAPPAPLTSAAGGPILLDPQAPQGARTLEPWYRVDVVLGPDARSLPVGSAGTVRFIVGEQTIGRRIWLRLRRMLHRRFLI